MPILIEKFEKDLDEIHQSDISSHSKNIILTPFYDVYQINICEYLTDDYSGIVLINYLGYEKADWISSELEDFQEKYPEKTSFELFNHMQELVNFNDPELVGCVAFKNYHDSVVSGAQIKAAFVQKDHQRHEIATKTYVILMDKYGAVISDGTQTPLAQKLWALSLPKYGDVSIYNSQHKRFLSQQIPQNKMAIWSIPVSDPNHFNIHVNVTSNNLDQYLSDHDCCQHVLLVLKHS